MAWTDPTNDVMLHGPQSSLGGLTAGGTIYTGCCVYLSADNAVSRTTANTQYGIGVCMYDASSGDYVAVHSIGCKVQGRLSGNCTIGAEVGAGPNGWWIAGGTYDTAIVMKAGNNAWGELLIHC